MLHSTMILLPYTKLVHSFYRLYSLYHCAIYGVYRSLYDDFIVYLA